MTEETKKYSVGRAWAITIILIISGVLIGANSNKVAACMLLMMQDLNVGEAQMGILLSMSTYIGIVLALPLGAIMDRVGPKTLGLIAIGTSAIGSLVSGLVPSWGVIMVGRFIEGIGFGMIAIIASTMISMWFPPMKRGLPMGIWGLWVGLGVMVAMSGSPMIIDQADPHTWTRVWIVLGVGLVVMFVLYLLVAKVPEGGHAYPLTPEELAMPAPEKVSFVEGIKNPMAWVMGLAFMMLACTVCITAVFGATYFQAVHGLDLAAANGLISLNSIAQIAGGFLGGFIFNHIVVKKRPIAVAILAIVTLICTCFYFLVPIGGATIYLILIGILFSCAVTGVFTATPDLAKGPAFIGLTMSIVIFCQNIGGITQAIAGSVLQNNGWGGLTSMLIFFCVAGSIFFLIYSIIQTKRFNKPAVEEEMAA